MVELPVGECVDKFKKYSNIRLGKVIEENAHSCDDRQNTEE